MASIGAALIRVLASVVQTGSDRDPSDVENCTARAARRLRKGGRRSGDISVAEVA